MSDSATLQLSDIKDANLLAAKLASAGGPLVVERLLSMAQVSDDPEVVRRIAETLLKFASQFQEKKDNTIYQPAVVTFDFSGSTGTIEVRAAPAPTQPIEFVETVEDETPPLPPPEPPEPTLELPVPENAMHDLEVRLMQLEDD